MPARRRLGRLMVRGAAVVALMALSSCLDSREEIWIHADGSGQARMSYQFPAIVTSLRGGPEKIRAQIMEWCQDHPEIHCNDCSITTTEQTSTLQLDLSAKRLRDLQQSLPGGPGGPDGPANALAAAFGRIDTQISPSGSISVRRNLDLGKIIPSTLLGPKRLAGHQWVTILHLPEPARISNATEVSDGGRTLTWSIPLKQALETPQAMEVEMALVAPWKLASAVALPLVLVVLLLRFCRQRYLSRRGF